jgi:hypothetical protein
MGQTPLLLVDNFFDTVNLYPLATLATTSEMTGREGFRVADYRRERSWWQTATVAAFHAVMVDLGAGKTATPDFVWLDRGHNLWGHSFQIAAGTDGVSYPTIVLTRAIPALNADGTFPATGDPTVGWAVTEEGACYALFSGAPAKRNWEILIADNMQPIITGAMLGARNQLLGYSKIFDEDAGERIAVQDASAAGYRGGSRPYAWRTCLLDLGAIGAPEYDGTMRQIRRWLFERNQPWVLCLDYAGHPERSWLFQYDGNTWAFPLNRVLRAGQIKGREVGALLI